MGAVSMGLAVVVADAESDLSQAVRVRRSEINVARIMPEMMVIFLVGMMVLTSVGEGSV